MDGASIFLVNKNDLYAVSGIPNLKGKNRYPIPAGERFKICSRLASDFKARLARYRQMHSTRDTIYLDLNPEFAELIRTGYSIRTIEIGWNLACFDSNLIGVGILALSTIQAEIMRRGRCSGMAATPTMATAGAKVAATPTMAAVAKNGTRAATDGATTMAKNVVVSTKNARTRQAPCMETRQ